MLWGVGGKRVDEGNGLTSRYMIAFLRYGKEMLGIDKGMLTLLMMKREMRWKTCECRHSSRSDIRSKSKCAYSRKCSSHRCCYYIKKEKKNKLSEEAMSNFIQLSLFLFIPAVLNVRKIARRHE